MLRELNRCFQDALTCGKRIRCETFISNIPLSTATIAANAAAALADRVISATSSPHRTVTLGGLKANGIKGRRLFIDLAVPADIDRSISGFGEFERIDIDGIGDQAKRNSLAQQDSARATSLIIEQELDRSKKELLFHFNSALINDICRQMAGAPQSVIYKLKGSRSRQCLRPSGRCEYGIFSVFYRHQGQALPDRRGVEGWLCARRKSFCPMGRG